MNLFSSSKGMCKFKLSLYGLKRLLKYDMRNNVLLDLDFPLLKVNDSSLFINRTFACIILLLLYVDDMIIIGSNNASIQQLKQHLQALFHMKYIVKPHYFFSLEVHSTLKGYLPLSSQVCHIFDFYDWSPIG